MKTTYITWHYTTHGIAYLKHILSHFYNNGLLNENLLYENLKQEELNDVFDKEETTGKKFIFDEIIYLTAPQETFDKLSTRRFSNKDGILDDIFIKENELVEAYKLILKDNHPKYNIETDISIVEKNFPDKIDLFKKSLWRNIHHYPIDEQIEWLLKYSNLSSHYKEKQFTRIRLDINDLRNETEITRELQKYINKDFENSKTTKNIINISLGSNETQVSWHVLAEARLLPENSRFIKTYDDKSDEKNKRFKKFSIKEVPVNLISTIGADLKVYDAPKSKKRELVNLKMQAFLKSGFTVLLLGERGIGKSELAKKNKEDQDSPFNEVNCASFDDDNKAESELFGHTKGAFTGANTNKKGLIAEADGGILLLDEVHHLSKAVQAKLMTAIQTDKNNKMTIRPMGATKGKPVSCRLIFATNKNINELKELLLPDFYDRIAQHVLKLPSLRETPEDRITDWEETCNRLKFEKEPKVPKDLSLINWIKTLDLYGNYRDLQKIAMYYNIYHQFDEKAKEMIEKEDGIKTAFAYTKKEFEKYHSPEISSEKEKFNFNTKQTTKEMIVDYRFELRDWAVKRFGGRKKAIEHFRGLNEKIDERTFNNWKNKISKERTN